MAEIDVCTTTYRNTDKLKICLSSVVEKTKFVNYKWYLMANDPNEEVKRTIHNGIFVDDIQFTDRIDPIFNDNNDGSFSSNNNELAAEGNSPYILFLNDDVEPLNASWLLSMKQILDSDPKVGAVGSLLVYPDKKIQHCGVFFSQRTNNLPFHLYYRQPVTDFMRHNRYYQAVTAACMLVRRDDFEALGGFDEEFRYGFEDAYYCLSLQKNRNKKIVYCGASFLVHHEGVSGSFKEHPHLQHNIEVFRKKADGMYYDDYAFYMNDPNFMLYNRR